MKVTFKQARRSFCDAAKRWARRQPDLKTAWAKCPNGCWMAWWLFYFRGGQTDIRYMGPRLWLQAGSPCVSGWFYDEERSAAAIATRRRYANLLRKHYSYSGRRLYSGS